MTPKAEPGGTTTDTDIALCPDGDDGHDGEARENQREFQGPMLLGGEFLLQDIEHGNVKEAAGVIVWDGFGGPEYAPASE